MCKLLRILLLLIHLTQHNIVKIRFVICISEATSIFFLDYGPTNVVLREVKTKSDMPHGTDRPYPIRSLAFF